MHKMRALRSQFWVAIDAGNQNGGVPIRTLGTEIRMRVHGEELEGGSWSQWMGGKCLEFLYRILDNTLRALSCLILLKAFNKSLKLRIGDAMRN